jgi:hypothetical protein
MGHLHPPSLDCFALDITEFWPLDNKNFEFKVLFSQKFLISPPNPNFWLHHCFGQRKQDLKNIILKFDVRSENNDFNF